MNNHTVNIEQRMNFNTELINKFGVSFWLQVGLLGSLVWSIEASGWVDSPPLFTFIFFGAILATLLTEIPSLYYRMVLVLSLGFVFTYVGGISMAESDTFVLRTQEVIERIRDWISAVKGEDATTDTLPLAMTIMFITWITAYFTSWGLFRHGNLWASIIPIGTLIVLNLTYLPDSFWVHLLAFIIFSLLLILHLTNIIQSDVVRSMGINNIRRFKLFSYLNGLMLTILMVATMLTFPITKSTPAPLEWVFQPLDRAFYGFQDELYRIFAAVPSHKPTSIRFFGSILPLVRPIPVDEDAVLFSNAKIPLYWSALAYDNYTSKAWKFEDTESKPVVSESQQLSLEDEEGVSGVSYQVEMHVDSPYVLSSGEIVDLDIDAEHNFLPGATFNIDLDDANSINELPDDLKILTSHILAIRNDKEGLASLLLDEDILVNEMRKTIAASDGVIASSEKSVVFDIDIDSPDYRVDLIKSIKNVGTIKEIDLVRKPLEGSSVFIDPSDRFGKGDKYSIVAQFNYSTEEELRNASGTYPPSITERYLQLPESLPTRVSRLALNLTENYVNNYDKAVAIESYIRTLEYSLESQSISHNVDTVDHFLFDSKQGSSDYFSSAMAIMLRTQDIPTRLVLGFGPGTADMDRKGFLVRDKDSHSWPEVYFPSIGWVPFEPTPIYETRPRGIPESPFAYSVVMPDIGEEGDNIIESGGMFDQSGESLERDDFGGPESGGEGPPPIPVRFFGTPLGLGGLAFILALFAFFVGVRQYWAHQFGNGGSDALTFYTKLRNIVTFLGFPVLESRTALELSRDLHSVMPEHREELDLITDTFVREKYGRAVSSPLERLNLVLAWKRIKASFIV
ncbi:MAG: hypothetical protein FI729_05665 [SAR202 cluster bacterium]|nr:hypothetical protein [SAR202 cluster bacterium]|tara:strand:- start:2755 stop:5307 length:2553 start_codon:yes stop_codon:yes gene_type:complete